jgi:hypothetical protein
VGKVVSILKNSNPKLLIDNRTGKISSSLKEESILSPEQKIVNELKKVKAHIENIKNAYIEESEYE